MKIGLKLWSTNLNYIPVAGTLFERGVFDYLELFVVPGSVDKVMFWQDLSVPYVLHAPHSYAGLNPALPAKEKDNHRLLKEVGVYFRGLDPVHVIFHPGIEGTADEVIRQFLAFRQADPEVMARAVLENKPAVGQKNERCLGASMEEVRLLLEKTGMGFCLDFTHAICASVFLKQDWKQMVQAFVALKPDMFHMCDGKYVPQDRHDHFGAGEFDIPFLISQLPQDARVSLETPKDSQENLDDFVRDAEYVRRYVRH